MRILVIGSGNIGTAVAFFMANEKSNEVSLIDFHEPALARFSHQFPQFAKVVKLINMDIFSDVFIGVLTDKYEVIISTLPWIQHIKLCNRLENYPLIIIGVARPDYDYYYNSKINKKDIQATIIHACGLEPGLSELFALSISNKFEKLHDVFIACGGIPLKPAPPLDYRLVFGGDHLPFFKEKH